MSRKKFLFGTSISIIDQTWLSGLNFLIGLSFIRYFPKEEYGIYLQLFAAVMLAISIHGALFVGPVLVLAPKNSSEKADRLIAHLGLLQAALGLCFIFGSLIILPLIGHALKVTSLNYALALMFGLWVFTYWQREYLRNIGFVEHEPSRAATLDFIFGLILLAGIGLILRLGATTLYSMITVLVLANLASLCWRGGRNKPWRELLNSNTPMRVSINEAWALAKWTLPGVLVTWVYSNAYLYVTAAMLGADETADLGTARLLLMPLVIMMTGWQNVFIPRASKWIGEMKIGLALRVSAWSLAGMALVTLLFMVTLALLFPYLQKYLLTDNYAHVLPYVTIWAIYFGIRCLTMSGNSVLIANGDFKTLFYYSLISMIAGLIAIVLGTSSHGAFGAIAGLAFAEIITAALIWLHGIPRLRRSIKNKPMS